MKMIQSDHVVYFPLVLLCAPKGDELPVRVHTTGGSGPARVWGHVKSQI